MNEQKSACITGNDGGGSDDDDDDLSTGAIIGGCTIDFCRAFNINSTPVYSCYLCNTEYIVSIKVVISLIPAQYTRPRWLAYKR